MADINSENRAVKAFQVFVDELRASTGAHTGNTGNSPKPRIPASEVDGSEVVDVFLKIHPEHKTQRDKLLTVGLPRPHFSDEGWRAAKSKADAQ